MSKNNIRDKKMIHYVQNIERNIFFDFKYNLSTIYKLIKITNYKMSS